MVTQCHLPNAASNGGFFCFCELFLSLVLRPLLRPSPIAQTPSRRRREKALGLMPRGINERVSNGLVKAC